MFMYSYCYVRSVLCIVSLFCSVYCLCVNVTALLPPDVNLIAVNRYIVSYIYTAASRRFTQMNRRLVLWYVLKRPEGKLWGHSVNELSRHECENFLVCWKLSAKYDAAKSTETYISFDCCIYTMPYRVPINLSLTNQVQFNSFTSIYA